MLALEGSPYLVPTATEASFLAQIRLLEGRVELLRGSALTDETLRRYYQNSRLRDVTEGRPPGVDRFSEPGDDPSAGAGWGRRPDAVLVGSESRGDDAPMAASRRGRVPGGEEMTFSKDQWVIRKGPKIDRLDTAELAARIARDLVALG